MNLNKTKDQIVYNLVALAPLTFGISWGLAFHFHSVIWAWICTAFVVISAAWAGLLYGFWYARHSISKSLPKINEKKENSI